MSSFHVIMTPLLILDNHPSWSWSYGS